MSRWKDKFKDDIEAKKLLVVVIGDPLFIAERNTIRNRLCEPNHLECFLVRKSAKDTFPVVVLLEQVVSLVRELCYWRNPNLVR